MWILLKSKIRFLVFYDNEGSVDKVLQTKVRTHWTDDLLDYTAIHTLNPAMPTNHIIDSPNHYQILHTFDSTDPISYIKSLQHTHPELFI